jgi:alkanesulfonate monooxygenase SsuD/methylene tetrahydromethanopterin reductase-like flavin-dependent oxidoreductase (luciferase family)
MRVGANFLRGTAGLRKRVVFGASLPPGVVAQQRPGPDPLAAVSQRTSTIRLGIGVVLAPIHHPLHVAARMATPIF